MSTITHIRKAQLLSKLREFDAYPLDTHSLDSNLIKWDSSIAEYLIEHYPDLFNEWWCPDKFPFTRYTFLKLIENCPEHLETWWVHSKIEDMFSRLPSFVVDSVLQTAMVTLLKKCTNSIMVWLESLLDMRCLQDNECLKCITLITPEIAEKIQCLKVLK